MCKSAIRMLKVCVLIVQLCVLFDAAASECYSVDRLGIYLVMAWVCRWLSAHADYNNVGCFEVGTAYLN
jgi:hypothetical protein